MPNNNMEERFARFVNSHLINGESDAVGVKITVYEHELLNFMANESNLQLEEVERVVDGMKNPSLSPDEISVWNQALSQLKDKLKEMRNESNRVS